MSVLLYQMIYCIIIILYDEVTSPIATPIIYQSGRYLLGRLAILLSLIQSDTDSLRALMVRFSVRLGCFDQAYSGASQGPLDT